MAEGNGGYNWVSDLLAIPNFITNTVLGAKNYKLQKEWNRQQQENWNNQFEYTKWLNQQQMQREDNAIQRRTADLEASGMNRLMAAGSEAQAGTLTSFTGNAGGSAPQMDIPNPIEAYLNAKQSQANIANTEASTALIRNQAETEGTKQNLNKALEGLYNIQNAKTQKEAVKVMIETLREYNDYKIESAGGFKSNDTTRTQNLYSMLELLVRLVADKFGTNIWDFLKQKGKGSKNPAFELDENGAFKDFPAAAAEIQKLYGGVY